MTVNNHTNTRRDFLKAIGLGAAAMAMPGCATITQEATGRKGKSKPNFILILTDDQGWTDTSVQMMANRPDSKSDFYQTPNLERLAREGMRFSNAYSPAPVCSPTRHSIQFGKTPARLRNTCHNKNRSRCEGEISIAQMIKAADPSYITAHFGKWHIKRSPEDMGYDKSDGRTSNGTGWSDDPDDPKLIFSVTGRANDLMAEQVKRERPFFMQISHYACHVRHEALNKTKEKYKDILPGNDPELIVYAAMTEDLDTGIGMLLDKIDQLGIADNTYIIHISDNGGGFGGNSPLKGGKANLWEGGIREPMVVRGPGIQAGTMCDVPVVGWDFFPTISDLISNKNPLPDGIDGGSLRPLFENGGEGKVRRPQEELIFHFPWHLGPQSAIRRGNYKLVKDWGTGQISLFNLADDIEESKNLAGLMPQKAKSLEKKLMDYLQAVNAETAEDIREEMLEVKKEKK